MQITAVFYIYMQDVEAMPLVAGIIIFLSLLSFYASMEMEYELKSLKSEVVITVGVI